MPSRATSDCRQLPDPLEPLFQRFALDELHDEVRQAGRLVLIHLVNGDEVIVGDGGGRAGLAAEPLPRDLVIRQLRVDHLDRHIASEAGIVGVQDDAHPAAADDPYECRTRRACPSRSGSSDGWRKSSLCSSAGCVSAEPLRNADGGCAPRLRRRQVPCSTRSRKAEYPSCIRAGSQAMSPSPPESASSRCWHAEHAPTCSAMAAARASVSRPRTSRSRSAVGGQYVAVRLLPWRSSQRSRVPVPG